MAQASTLPGVRFQVRAASVPVSPLRTDIGGFAGPTMRGPVGEPVRLEGWRDYIDRFGGLTRDADLPFALRGYFENGGEVAYVVRTLDTASATASAVWTVGARDSADFNRWDAESPAGGGFGFLDYTVVASSPGAWANGTRVRFDYRLDGRGGVPRVNIEVRTGDGAVESLLELPTTDLGAAVAERSRLIRLVALTPGPTVVADPGPRVLNWEPVILAGGSDLSPGYQDYLNAATQLAGQREVALLAMPDLDRMVGSPEQRSQVLATLIALSEAAHDRLVVVGIPEEIRYFEEVLDWLADRRAGLDETAARSLAVYHPWIRVADPLGGINRPLREVSPVGHVAGVISRLDRERGAHHTPANAALLDAVDLAHAYSAEDQGALAMAGINPLRCAPGRGLVVWGGRTAVEAAVGLTGLFIAHRRLIHRLVRAIRRVAEPLVFDTNGPDLWLKLVRAITHLLLEAFRAGALQGVRPEHAFLVRCDETNNPPESIDLGRVVCDVSLAPAVPMEFITLRIALSREAGLEVLES